MSTRQSRRIAAVKSAQANGVKLPGAPVESFKVGDTIYCTRSGPGCNVCQVPVGTRGEILQVPGPDYVVVRWELEGCQFTQPSCALSKTPPVRSHSETK